MPTSWSARDPLFVGLIDDAAVFPPGNAPIDVAFACHLEHRQQWYAASIGPLLLPVADANRVRDLAGGQSERLSVGLISRPNSDPAQAASAAHSLANADQITVAGLEVAWQPRWRSLGLDNYPLALEVGRGREQLVALDDLVAARDEGWPVIAKFRTGATDTWAWPDERDVATFVLGCVQRGLPLKLTGGLHHLVRADHGEAAEPQHGLLNVLCAVAEASRQESEELVVSVLAERNLEVLTGLVRSWEDTTVASVRATFASYGCCDVTDPLYELTDLGLLTKE